MVPQTHVSGKDVIKYYLKRSPAIQAVQEVKGTSKPSEVQTALPLKWLIIQPIYGLNNDL